MTRSKAHRLLVTVTHDNPVSHAAAVSMFRNTFCQNRFTYYSYCGPHDGPLEDTGKGYIVSVNPTMEVQL